MTDMMTACPAPLTTPATLAGGTHDAAAAAHRFISETGGATLATVIETWGSAPVPVGGQMAVAGDGRFAGSVSGGCIETDVLMAAQDALRTGHVKVLSFGVANETAWRAGLPCGGKIRVLVEPFKGDEGAAFLARVAAAAATREGLVVATRLETGVRTAVSIADLAQSLDGQDLPGEFAAKLAGGDSRLHAGPGGAVFYKTYAPPARIVIIGATHIAQVLAGLAQLTGYAAIVVDPRDIYAGTDRFEGVRVVAEWPRAALAELGLDAFTAVVALSHIAHLDDEALSAALTSPCRYIGALGSRKNHAKRCDRLRLEGFTDADLARIRAPVGLDIGALTPAEIAVAVLAEIIESVRGKKRG